MGGICPAQGAAAPADGTFVARHAGRDLTEEESRKTEFPIYGRDPLTEGLQRRKVGLLAEDLQRTIRGFQPNELGDDYANSALWLMSELDNRNKHRTIEPQLMAFSGIMPTFFLTESVSVVLPRSPLHDGLEVFAARPAGSSERRSLIASMRVVFPRDDLLCEGRVGGMEVVHGLRRLHQYVRLIQQRLLGQAGYLYPFPESNAPQEAHEEDQAAWFGGPEGGGAKAPGGRPCTKPTNRDSEG